MAHVVPRGAGVALGAAGVVALLLAFALPAAASPSTQLESADDARPTPPRPTRFPEPAPLPQGPGVALRTFEQQTIPEPDRRRAGVVLHVPDAASKRPRRRRARPSALHPPAPLRTEIGATAAVPSRPGGTAERWHTRLRLPDLPIRWDEKLLRYLDFYRNNPRGRAIFTHWLARMGRYERMIRAELRRQELPQALIYVAMIESAFDPSQTSPVGAAGLWQFMVTTGADYGLRRDHWIDERRNPQLATRAALRLLKNLHERLGSWELALAAYNAGFGGVVQAMRKYNTNDYWRLCDYEAGLPWSTALYVPKILAAAIVGSNREAFGFADVAPDPPLEFELAAVPTSRTLKELARAAGVELKRMAELNPELRRGRTPPYPRVWVRIPRGASDRFYAQLESLGRARYGSHVVKLGESDRSIAKAYGISWRKLRRINQLRSASELRPGLTIFVPAVRQKRARNKSAARRTATATGGEGADTILVALPRDAPSRVDGRPKRVFYRVVLGDSLWRISRHLKCTPEQLARWNAIDPSGRLVSGMVLQAFVPRGFSTSAITLLDARRIKLVTTGSAAFLDLHEQRKGRRRLSYTVRRGDSLKRIARRFGLSVGSLLRINRFGYGTKLEPGDKVVVYVERRAARERSRRKTRRRVPASTRSKS